MTLDGDWLRPFLAGLLACVAVAVLGALARKAPADKTGWRRITPGPMHWTGIGLGTALVFFMAYIRLFVGSGLADAERQMTFLTWLIVAFALGTIFSAFSVAAIRRRAVRWRGTQIVWQNGGREVEADLDALSAIGRNWLGQGELRFADGSVLRVDLHARSAQQLIEQAEERFSRPAEAG